MNTTEHKLTAVVEGRTWGGFLTEMEYKLKPSQVDDFKSLADFKKIAADFETINHVELILAQITTKYTLKSFE